MLKNRAQKLNHSFHQNGVESDWPQKSVFFIEECELPAESKLVLHKIAKKEFQLCLQLHNEHQFLFNSYLVYFINVSYF